MSHSIHRNLEGQEIPSVSQIPGIFAQDISGFEDWICRGLHEKEAKCCIRVKREFYQESADLGNDIHSLREAFLKGEAFEDGVPEYQAKVFDPVAKFYKESGYTPIKVPIQADFLEAGWQDAVELKLTGKYFGGTIDGVGQFNIPFWESQRKTFWDKYSLDYLNQQEFPDLLLPTTKTIWIEDLKIKSKLDPLHPLQLYGYRLLLQEVHGIIADWGLIIRREKKLDKKPEIQLKAYYLPAYKEQWNASILMWKFLYGN